MKKIFLIVSLVVLTLCATTVTSGCQYGDWKWVESGGYRYDNADKYVVGNFTYNAVDVDEVDISWISGTIDIVQADGATLAVAENEQESLSDAEKLHWFLDGRTLRIKYMESGYTMTDSSRVTDKKRLSVEVPAGIKIDVESVSAPVTMGDINAREVEIETVSGVVATGNVRVSADLDIETTSGIVRLGDIDALNIDIDTVSGNVKLGVNSATRVEVETTSGMVELALHIGATVSYTTTSGEMNSALTSTTSGNKHVFGNGACAIEVQTVSGNLSIL